MSAYNLPEDCPKGSVFGPLLFFLHTKSKGSMIKSQVEFMSSRYGLQRAQHYTVYLDSELYTCFSVPGMTFAEI